MTEFETASLAVREWTLWVTASLQALAVGAILLGIWQMRRAGDQREKREDQRHREAMRSLEALIKGMETVIERTTGGRA